MNAIPERYTLTYDYDQILGPELNLWCECATDETPLRTWHGGPTPVAAVAHFAAEHEARHHAPIPEKRTASDWCAEYGIVVHGADGWKGENAPAWADPIALEDFAQRIARSSVVGGRLHGLMDDAARVGAKTGRP